MFDSTIQLSFLKILRVRSESFSLPVVRLGHGVAFRTFPTSVGLWVNYLPVLWFDFLIGKVAAGTSPLRRR